MIQVENLTKNYSGIPAVDQINFDIQKGEILGLLGPNGAGKTTTLRMLTGFLRPSAGTIRVKELDIERQPIEIKKIIGYLPESAPLYHDMLVYDYLNYVADIREIAPQRKLARIRELGDLCGLNPVMHKPIAELSKGFKQRVGLAHAMMSDPEILILDEPTSGLDPNQIVEIRDIIKRIGQQKTVVLSTHILSEAEVTCNRVVIISRGKIVADGDVDKLKQSAGDTSLIHLTLWQADGDAVRQKLSATAGVQEIVRLEAANGQLKVTLSVPSSRDLRGEIYHTVKQTDWELLEFYQETRTLETVFRELTREN
ncbi:MAG: ATP-binding cassette domain-containing protein [Deltaproteobacteria bacterium]|nr:ATP-binding cassette domain-containing protein [Deltaproteobacteria bacterium]